MQNFLSVLLRENSTPNVRYPMGGLPYDTALEVSYVQGIFVSIVRKYTCNPYGRRS